MDNSAKDSPFYGFLQSITQMLANEKRAALEAEMAQKRAEFERLHGTKCNWDDFYAKNKCSRKLDMKFNVS